MQFHRKQIIVLIFATIFTLITLSNANADYGTRIYVKDFCPVGDPGQKTKKGLTKKDPKATGALVGIGLSLLPSAIDYGVDLLKKAIENAAKENTETRSDYLPQDSFYKISAKTEPNLQVELVPQTFLKCLIVARGEFDDGKFSTAGVSKAWKSSQARSHVDSIGLSKRPGVYLEAYFIPSPDKTLMRLQPVFFDYQIRLHDGETKKANGKFDLVVEILLEDQNSPEGKSFAIWPLRFEGIERGTQLKTANLAHKTSKWLNLKPTTKNLDEAFSEFKKKIELWKTVENVKIEDEDKTKSELEKELNALPKKKKTLEQLEKIHDEKLIELELDAQLDTSLAGIKDAIELAKRKILRHNIRQSKIEKVRAARTDVEGAISKINLAKKKLENISIKKNLNDHIQNVNNQEHAPYGITINIRETKRASKFWKKVSGYFEVAEGDLKQALKERFVASERAKLAATLRTAEAAKVEGKLSALEAQYDVEAKQAALDALLSSGDVNKLREAQSNLRISQVKANIAFIKAGLNPPYPDAEL